MQNIIPKPTNQSPVIWQGVIGLLPLPATVRIQKRLGTNDIFICTAIGKFFFEEFAHNTFSGCLEKAKKEVANYEADPVKYIENWKTFKKQFPGRLV